MFDIVIAGLAIFGAISVAVCAVSKVSRISLEEAEQKVLDLIKGKEQIPEVSFSPDAVVVNEVLDAVVLQSNLTKEYTIWRVENESFPVISVQILPKNGASIEIASQAAATIITNAALAVGMQVDTEPNVLPAANGCSVIQIGVASTSEQKEALSRCRLAKNMKHILNAGGGQRPFADEELLEDLFEINSSGDADA